MPKNLAELVDILKLTRRDEFFVGAPGNTFFQRTYGGQVLAQALMASYATVDDDRIAHSLHSYFLRAAKTSDSIDYAVEPARDGGSFSVRRVVAQQGQGTSFIMAASFHKDEPGLDHTEPQPTDVDPPEECPPITEVMDERFGVSPIWHEWDCLDVRFAGDSSTATTNENRGKPQAWMRVWVRTVDSLPASVPARLHQAVLAYLSDMTLLSVSALPHEVAFMSTSLQAASLSHSMWFHRPCRVDRWLLYDMESPNAHASLGFSTGRLFQDGALIASCVQEGLVRLVDSREILT